MNLKTDFLRFSAYSMKDLITRKLSEDSRFTDLIYEGSNLAILIDIVSYMYQCLIYLLNSAASESMFSDTQLYENINRLCTFLNYNPKGCSTATCIFTLDNSKDELGRNQFENVSIPRYSFIDTKKTDSSGNKIYYSTRTKQLVRSVDLYEMIMYNGRWHLYNTIFSGTGSAYLTLTLDQIGSDSSKLMYVPSDMIDVYVDEGDGPILWTRVDQGLFTDNNIMNGSFVYKQNSKIYNVRLNEQKKYEITFGNNFSGKIPARDSVIYVFYLQSNGPDGVLDAGDIKNELLKHSSSYLGISDDLYEKMFLSQLTFDNTTNLTQQLCDKGNWTNSLSSSSFKEEESVDEIRRNVPEWFKTGNRLVTASDWEYYVKNRFRNNIIDVKCQNNWGYISTFYRWLYNLGITQHNDSKYYINQNKLSRVSKYADASDVNNVYLWIKMKDDSDVYSTIIDEEVLDIKTLTQEPVYLKSVDVNFTFCALDTEDARFLYFNNALNSNEFDPNNYSYLEITLDDMTVYTTSDIHNQVINIIKNFFNENNFVLGLIVNYSDLANLILLIKSVSRIRTVYHNELTGDERIINGISFATWTNLFIDLGDDLDVSSSSRSLEVFQFPKLYKSGSIGSRVKVIKKTINSINSILY